MFTHSQGAHDLTQSHCALVEQVTIAYLIQSTTRGLSKAKKWTRGNTSGSEQLEKIIGKKRKHRVFSKAIELSGAENSRGSPHYKGMVGNEARKENWNQICRGGLTPGQGMWTLYCWYWTAMEGFWAKGRHDGKVFRKISLTAICRKPGGGQSMRQLLSVIWRWVDLWFGWF